MNKKDLIALSILTLSVVFYFFSILFLDHVIYMGDNSSLFIPIKTYIAEEFKKGNVPLWNPYLLSGTPLLADISAGVFYPSNILYVLFTPFKALSYTVILHILFSGVSFYYLAKEYKFSFFSSLLTALLFMFSGTVLQLSQNSAALEVLTWIPLSILLIEKYFKNPRSVFIAAYVLALVLQLFAGHFQFFYYNVLFYGAYILFKIQAPWSKKLFFSIFSGLFFVLIGSIQLLPFLELTQFSTRPVGDYKYASTSFPAINLIHLIFANFFGIQNKGTSWGAQANIIGYIGVLPILITIFAFIKYRNREFIFFSVVAIIVFFLAIGYHSPFYYAAFHLVPFFNRFRSPISILTIYTFAVCVLSGYAFEYLISKLNKSDETAKQNSVILRILFGVVCILLIARTKLYSVMYVAVEWLYSAISHPLLQKFLNYSDTQLEVIFTTWTNNILGITFILFLFLLTLKFHKKIPHQLTIAVLLTLCVADTVMISRNAYMTTTTKFEGSVPVKTDKNFRIYAAIDPPSRPPFGDENYFYKEVLKQYIYAKPNTNMVAGLYSIDGYASIVQKEYAQYVTSNKKNVTSVIVDRFPSKQLNTLGVKYIFSSEENKKSLEAAGYPLIKTYKSPELQKTYYVYENKTAKPRAYLKTNTGDKSVEIAVDNGEYLKITFLLPTQGTLIFNDVYYKDWYAKINNKVTSVQRYQEIFRAVTIAEATRTVELLYQPKSYEYGKYLSLVGILLLFVFYKKTNY